MYLHVWSPQKTEGSTRGSRKGKVGALGDTSGLKHEGTVSLLCDKEAKMPGPGRPGAVGHTSFMRQLCEFRSRWMMHMECK